MFIKAGRGYGSLFVVIEAMSCRKSLACHVKESESPHQKKDEK